MSDNIIQQVFTIGFSGAVRNGVLVYGDMIIYPCGSKIILYDIRNNKQKILQEEFQKITTISISSSGRYIAAAYVTNSGFKALICLWNLETLSLRTKYESHRDEVHSLAFSKCEKFLFSLGGYDDDNGFICYNIDDEEIVCGHNSRRSISGDADGIKNVNYYNRNFFITFGDNTLRIWILENTKFSYTDADFTKIKRKILCIQISDDTSFIYCGTCAGDVMKFGLYIQENKSDVSIRSIFLGCCEKLIRNKRGNKNERYSLGVTSLLLTHNNNLVIGSGEGIVELVKEEKNVDSQSVHHYVLPVFLKIKSVNIGSAVTSIVNSDQLFFVASERCEIFRIDKNFNLSLIVVGHCCPIKDIAFPTDYSDVFAIAVDNSIQMWQMGLFRLLFRIFEKYVTCHSILFAVDGSSLISAWSDGCIRGYTPQSGSLMYKIVSSCIKEPAVICIAQNIVISGDCTGEIRFWHLENKNKISLKSKLKQHTRKILSVNSDNKRFAVSSSLDRFCIVWDIINCRSIFKIFTNTISECVKFHPSENELITCGRDKLIKFWDSKTGDIRHLIEGSCSHSINQIDISSNGKFIASVDNGSLLKIWLYKDKKPISIEMTNSGLLECVKFSPNGRHLLTSGIGGDMIIYKFTAPSIFL